MFNKTISNYKDINFIFHYLLLIYLFLIIITIVNSVINHYFSLYMKIKVIEQIIFIYFYNHN